MDGTWNGHYYYGNGLSEESTFTLLAQSKSNKVYLAGSGRDDAGIFTIQGNVDTNCEITFSKRYPEHSWTYSGSIDRVKETMIGKWGGTGAGGSFTFNRHYAAGEKDLDSSQETRYHTTDLCELCCLIPFEHLPSLPKCYTSAIPLGPGLILRPPNVWEHRPTRFGFQHHQDLKALEQSSDNCPLCSLIHKGVTQFNENVKDGPRNENGRKLQSAGPKDYRLQITANESDPDGFMIWTDATIDTYIFLVAVVSFCVENGKIQQSTFVCSTELISLDIDDDPLSHRFKGRIVHEDPSSPTALDRVSEWVKKCDDKHKRCKPDLVSLPTRVLHVGDQSSSNHIRLWETGGEIGSYTTLSHCWGTSRPLITTLATMDEKKERIDLDNMDKTFQDAVAITRALGIQNLWVDSLCICQDDETDWERESSRMAEIFSNSYLTIAAASAKDGSVGCFIHHSPRGYVSFGYASNKGSGGKLYAFLVPVERGLFTHDTLSLKDEPLSSRTWTVQERILSRRSLFYCKDQTYFECKEEFKGEDGFHSKGRLIDIEGYLSLPNQSHEHIKGYMKGLWDSLIRLNMGRKLTKSSDKLPALSGVAKRFEELLQDKYVAGLWESTLLGDLLWDSLGVRGPWPPVYRAPSWSWTCIDDASPAMDRYRQCSKFATIVDFHIHTKGSNPYGEVDDGWIKLKAPLVQLFVNEDPATRWAKGVFGFMTANQKGMEHNTFLDYDIDVERLRQLSLFAIVFGRDTLNKPTILYPSLLVTPTGDGKYRRLTKLLLDEDGLGECAPKFGDDFPVITLI